MIASYGASLIAASVRNEVPLPDVAFSASPAFRVAESGANGITAGADTANVPLLHFLYHEEAHYWATGANALGPENWLNERLAEYLAGRAVRALAGVVSGRTLALIGSGALRLGARRWRHVAARCAPNRRELLLRPLHQRAQLTQTLPRERHSHLRWAARADTRPRGVVTEGRDHELPPRPIDGRHVSEGARRRIRLGQGLERAEEPIELVEVDPRLARPNQTLVVDDDREAVRLARRACLGNPTDLYSHAAAIHRCASRSTRHGPDRACTLHQEGSDPVGEHLDRGWARGGPPSLGSRRLGA